VGAVPSACDALEFREAGRNRGGSILRKALDQERATDKKLTTLAESKVRAAS
jgi:ferritin-like metal-binding protein YciE